MANNNREGDPAKKGGKNKGGEGKETKIDFDSLTLEQKKTIVNSKLNSGEGLSNKELDFYNSEMLKVGTVTGRSQQYIKAPKPTQTPHENIQTGKPETINDLSDLANLTNEFPENNPNPEAKAGEVNSVADQIEEDRKKGTQRAQTIAGKKGAAKITENTQNVTKKVDEILEEVAQAEAQNTTPENTGKQPTEAELLERLNKAESAGNQIKEQIQALKVENENLTSQNNTKIDQKAEEEETEDVKVEEAFDLEKAFEEAKGRINTFIDTRAEELKNKIVDGTATGDDFEELNNLENPDLNPKPNEPEENEENEKPKLSIGNTRELIEQEIKQKEEAEGRELTDAEKLDIAREIFLAESEKTYKEQQEKAGKFKKFLKKTENWWLGIDDKGNKLEQSVEARAGKVALATAITSVGALVTGDLTRLATRVGWATGISTLINTALTSNKVKEILTGFKKEKKEEEEKNKKLIQKIFNAKNLLAATSVGTSLLLAGPLMAIAAGGGIAARELINYYFDKNIPKSQERLKELDKEIKKISTTPGNFDINYVLGKLEIFEKEKKDLSKDIRFDARIKSLLNTGVTAGVGYASYGIGEHQHHIENNKAPEIKEEVETKDAPEKSDTVSADEIPKQEESFWSKTINKIKNFGQGKKEHESIASNKYGNVEDLKNEDENENTESNENTPHTENNNGETKDASSDKNSNPENSKNEEVVAQKDNNEESEARDNKGETQDNNNEVDKATDNKPEEQSDNSKAENIKNTEKTTEYKTGDKIDVKNLKPESIIDSQKNVGETYVYRSLIRSDEELAQKLAKYQGLDLEKVNDDRYMANYLRKLAIKLGRMDTEGHEIRYNKEAVDNISLKLDVNKDGKLIAYEIDKTGLIKDVHHEGDQFEKDLESYEEAKLKKTYADIEKAYDKNSGIVAPERTPEYEQQLSNSYSAWEDDSREYLENSHLNNPANTPDDLSNDEIVAPEKINTSYTLENYDKYQDWNKIKSLNLKSFLDKSQNSDMYGVEGKKFSVSLKDFYQKALEASNNDEDFTNFVRNNPNLTVEEATNLYKDVVKEGDFTDSLKEKYNFFEWKESLNPKLELSKQEAEFTKETLEDKNIENILKEKYGKNIFKNENFFSNKEVKSIYFEYQKNLKLLDEKMYGDIKSEIAGQKVNGYLNEHENSLTDYIKKVQEKLGEAGNPKKVVFWGERLDKYLLRVTALAKLKGININPKDLLDKDDQGNNLNNDDLNEYRPSKRMGDLKKEDLGEYKPYPNSNQEEVKTKDDLDEYKPSKKTQLNDDLNRNK